MCRFLRSPRVHTLHRRSKDIPLAKKANSIDRVEKSHTGRSYVHTVLLKASEYFWTDRVINFVEPFSIHFPKGQKLYKSSIHITKVWMQQCKLKILIHTEFLIHVPNLSFLIISDHERHENLEQTQSYDQLHDINVCRWLRWCIKKNLIELKVIESKTQVKADIFINRAV